MKDHKQWLQGYDCALIDFEMFINENKRLFAPSTYKTFKKRFYIKFKQIKM
jgi:hypothetical protein